MRVLLLMVLILILIVGCTSLAPMWQKTPENGDEEKQTMLEEIPTSIIVKMKDGEFDKPIVKIKRGGTITWKNDDVRPYLFTIYYEDVDEKGNVQIEKVPSGRINDGEEFSFTFEKIGEYKIVPIEYGNLRGVVQ